MRLVTLIGLFALIAAPVPAQTTSCSSLTVTGSLSPGSTLTMALTGSTPDAFTLLFIGEQVGTTSFSFGMLGGFTLDLDPPFIPFPFGLTDANGDRSISISVPAGATLPASIPSTTLNLQAVSFDLTFSMMGPPLLLTCVSNLATVTLP